LKLLHTSERWNTRMERELAVLVGPPLQARWRRGAGKGNAREVDMVVAKDG
jgi:hypothetical protein